MDTVVSVTDVRSKLEELLDRAARGERLIIRRRGKRSVALVPFPKERQKVGGRTARESDGPQRDLSLLSGKLGDRFSMSDREQRRLEILAKKSKCDGQLTGKETEELDQLLHRLEDLSRQKAEAIGNLL
ncbi:MAG: type II toxin-antitoxin system prevent-host-death family antitoxin [Armatimonadetes bacterium]|nr:type II toxin-antitoxin system prevent-host-death family antitoxin [Armatimonadota bacterium]